jgi:hypothetical protein
MHGSIFAVRATWIILAMFWACAIMTGGLSVLALPFLIAAWIVFAVMTAEIGVWCSLASRNTLRATSFTLAILAGISLAPLVLGLAWNVLTQALGVSNPDSLESALLSFGASPPLVLWDLAFANESRFNENLPAALVGLGGYTLIAWLLWRRLNTRFGRLTGRMPMV